MASEAEFPAVLSELPKILAWVRQQIEQIPVNDSEKKKIELSLEEAVVNVITHAAKERPLDIALLFNHEPGHRLEFQLKDFGPPFNPLDHIEDPETEFSLEERTPGGLGLTIMRNYMDALLYRREGDQNIFTLIKDISI